MTRHTGAPHVVVVGSGIAGLTAARVAARRGCRVTVVAKGTLIDSATAVAQGGVAAALRPDDTSAAHARDTITAGHGHNNAEAVAVLTGEGPERVRELVELGVPFDRDTDGALRWGLEAAHGTARIVHAGGDATGAAIEHTLVASVRNDAEVIEHACLVDVVVHAGRACGVQILIDGRHRIIPADAVVLATGGAGHLYTHTTSPAVVTGDGIAAAARAGAAIRDMEFVQFHPTVFIPSAFIPSAFIPSAFTSPGSAASFLVSEAVRGEGATLIDDAGERFLFDAHPDGELAPRDVVTRAVVRRMAAQHGHPVRLDATRLGAGFLAHRFPTIDAALHAAGWDWAREPVPVTPAAHYLMGGIATDLHGRSTLPGLYAAGEAAHTGVHGANRLASNSLLEGAVFGARAGAAVDVDLGAGTWPASSAAPGMSVVPAVPFSDAPQFSRAALQQLMWQRAGVLRSGVGLAEAASILAAWCARPHPRESVRQIEDANLLQVAALVVAAAQARTASLGAHHLVDDNIDDDHDDTAARAERKLVASC